VKAHVVLPIPAGVTLADPCMTAELLQFSGRVDVRSTLSVPVKGKILATINASAVLTATESAGTVLRGGGNAVIDGGKLISGTLPLKLPSLKVNISLASKLPTKPVSWTDESVAGTLTLTNVIISGTITADPIKAKSIALKCSKTPITYLKVSSKLPIPAGLVVTDPCTTTRSLTFGGEADARADLAVRPKGKTTGMIEAGAVLSATESISNKLFRGGGNVAVDAAKLNLSGLPIQVPSLKLRIELVARAPKGTPPSKVEIVPGTLTLTHVVVSNGKINADPITVDSFGLTCPRGWKD
jgi:hypothetical protein